MEHQRLGRQQYNVQPEIVVLVLRGKSRLLDQVEPKQIQSEGRNIMNPVVTIGVCVKNCESSITRVIETILDQDFPHEKMEAVFVDDGSEDRTLSLILDSIPTMDAQTKVFHSEWRGLGQARNTVVNNASGDYIVWVDGDMTLSKDFVRRQVEFMEKNSRVGIAKGRYGAVTSGNLVEYLENALWEPGVRGYGDNPLPGTGGSVYRVEAIREIGGFDDRFWGAGEDIEAAYRVRAAGWRISRTQAEFFESRKPTWRALWREKFWKGYGMHQAFHKHYDIDRLYELAPLVGFAAGLLHSLAAYQKTRRKMVFLLPLHYFFVKTALCCGYVKSHIDSHGHHN